MGEHRDGEPGRGCAVALAGGVLLWLILTAVAVYLAAHH